MMSKKIAILTQMPRYIAILFALPLLGCNESAKAKPLDKNFAEPAKSLEEQLTYKQTATKINGTDSSINNNENTIDSTLVGHVEGYVEKSSITERDWENVKCKDLSVNDGYSTIEGCIFPNASLQQVYDIVKKIDSNSKIELPLTNIEYSCSTESACLGVSYHYKSEKHLFIEFTYEGGTTYVEIIEGENNAQSKITYSR